MKRISHLSLVLVAALGCAWAQDSTPISSITIGTSPTGARFYVDGQLYYTSQTFLWPQGTKHTISFATVRNPDGTYSNYQISQDQQIEYTFSGWTDPSGLLAVTGQLTMTITADPAITSLIANLTVAYRTQLVLPNTGTTQPVCGQSPGNPPQDGLRAGIVYIGAQCYGGSTSFYTQTGSVILNAIAYPGWAFTGWNINGGTFTPSATSYTVTGPTIIIANFTIAQRVAFLTSPPGMTVLVDRTPTPTSSSLPLDQVLNPDATCSTSLSFPPAPPINFQSLCLGSFDFIPGSQHTIGAASPQVDNTGKYWVFDSFDNGQANNTVFTAPSPVTAPVAITAKFLPGVQMAFLTNPVGLKIQVDGRDNWPSDNFMWAQGSSHTVAVAATQMDAKGREWTFQSWSNGGPMSQTVTADGAVSRLMANYSGMSEIQILSTPSNIHVQVDGAACTTPCTINRPAGAKVALVAPASVPVATGARLDFQSWNDGATASRTYTVGGDATITAAYSQSYLLTTSVDPVTGSVNFLVNPSSPDGFYTANTKLSITAQPNAGFKFLRWGGALSGTYNIGQLTIAGPTTVIATVLPVPYVAPAGVQSAAGKTPDGTVAPGSLISIYGQNLAPGLLIGPASPLAQTLNGVVVTVADRLLPLMFVSPQQINAQLPSDLPDGSYTLTVQTTGQPDVTGAFTVARNAPGLFTRMIGANFYVMASHEDGSPVTPDSPARRNETISIFGTGFGPYSQTVIDGFALPASPIYTLADPVTVTVAGSPIQPVSVGGAPGFVGTVVVKIAITDDLPTASTVPVVVSVNGKSSNPVMLPLE
jgi:uncharacterized protein (TIGR03437 family)